MVIVLLTLLPPVLYQGKITNSPHVTQDHREGASLGGGGVVFIIELSWHLHNVPGCMKPGTFHPFRNPPIRSWCSAQQLTHIRYQLSETQESDLEPGEAGWCHVRLGHLEDDARHELHDGQRQRVSLRPCHNNRFSFLSDTEICSNTHRFQFQLFTTFYW